MRNNPVAFKASHSKVFIIKALFVWLLFIPIAFINGFIREILIKPMAGELFAHQISCLLASLAFFILAYLMLNQIIEAVEDKVLWIVAGVWLFLTILFEFGLGRLNDTSWERLLIDYAIFKGRLWIFVLLTIMLTPVLIKRSTP